MALPVEELGAAGSAECSPYLGYRAGYSRWLLYVELVMAGVRSQLLPFISFLFFYI